MQIFPELQQDNFCSLSPARRAVHIISSPPADGVFVVSLNMLYWLSKGVTVNECSPHPGSHLAEVLRSFASEMWNTPPPVVSHCINMLNCIHFRLTASCLENVINAVCYGCYS